MSKLKELYPVKEKDPSYAAASKPQKTKSYYKCFECSQPFVGLMGNPCKCGSTKFYSIEQAEHLTLLSQQKETQP